MHYKYIIYKLILLITFINEPELILFAHILMVSSIFSVTNNSIYY